MELTVVTTALILCTLAHTVASTRNCPKLFCRYNCTQGRRMDFQECERCECMDDPCPVLDECNKLCEFGYERDKYGCERCYCRPSHPATYKNVVTANTTCPVLLCDNACVKGRVVRDGCTTCQCRLDKDTTCGPVCKNFCPFGRMYNGSGCATCTCYKPSCPRVGLCTNSCSNGYHYDHMGCQTCTCIGNYVRKPGCPIVNCLLFCEYGFKDGKNGCPMCECKITDNPAVCSTMNCALNCTGEGFKKDADGCKICECDEPDDCIQRNCSNVCKFGYFKDTDGCNTCQCKPFGTPCPPQRCPECGPHAMVQDIDQRGCLKCHCLCPKLMCPICPGRLYQRDRYGCLTCECKNASSTTTSTAAPTCPAVRCSIFCPGGYEHDQFGCPTCQCTCPAVRCSRHCPGGYVQDQFGCPTCQCNCPDVVCDLPCPSGYKKDENGCYICECEAVCPHITCNKFCPDGYERDENGCPLCECICRKPNCTNECPNGYGVNEQTGCPTCKCDSPCPVTDCRENPCTGGYLRDTRGCQTCNCRMDTVCPVFFCTIDCPFNAYRLNVDGCRTCRCQGTVPVICPPLNCTDIVCPFGTERDPVTGCDNCSCRFNFKLRVFRWHW